MQPSKPWHFRTQPGLSRQKGLTPTRMVTPGSRLRLFAFWLALLAPSGFGDLRPAQASPTSQAPLAPETCTAPLAPAESDIIPIQQTARLAEDCAPLASGESRLVAPALFSADPNQSDLSYRITADAERPGSLHITLREKFRAWDGIKRDRDQEAQIRERANACLAALAPWLRGPQGEELHVRYEEKSDATRRLRPQDIDILNKERSNSGQWDSDLGCGTIVHETFHLLGLVDEYEEIARGMKRAGADGKGPWVPTAVDATLPAYDCRRVRQNDSLMGNHHEALRRLTPLYRMTSCLCDPTNESCLKQLESWTSIKSACPADSIETRKEISVFTGFDLGKGAPPLAECTSALAAGEKRICGVIERAPTGESLLLPDQCNAVIFPRCTPLNQRYRACAANAYLTSNAHQGMGCSKKDQTICNGTDAQAGTQRPAP